MDGEAYKATPGTKRPHPDSAAAYASSIPTMSAYTPPPPQDLEPPKAPQACLSCRKQKRKCNKALPACALCERMSRHCDYSEAAPAPTSEDFNALRQKLIELEGRLNLNGGNLHHSPPYSNPTPSTQITQEEANVNAFVQEEVYQSPANRFPAIAFLDSEAFKYGGINVPKSQVQIPVDVLTMLGDANAIQAVVTEYFATIHTWFPIVSKKRMTQNMINPLWEAGSDLALLFLCMKLNVTRLAEGESSQSPIYYSAKKFIALAEASGMASLMVLQAMLLITLYEFGQAIYPAAYMTSGACVRYGLLLGINGHPEAAQLLGRADTWTEIEERRRSWWGVRIMDRAVTVGGQGHPLSSEDPIPEENLPCDDAAWDAGELLSSTPVTVSAAITSVTGPFARLCQASSALGKVIRHHARQNHHKDHWKEALELHAEIRALTTQIMEEAATSSDYLSLSAPMATCFSALATLYDSYACNNQKNMPSAVASDSDVPVDQNMQLQAVHGIKAVSLDIKNFAEQIISRTPYTTDVDRISPLVMDSLYSGAANWAWFVRESGDEGAQMALDVLRACLRRVGERWRNAAEYLRILEAQEFTYAIGGAGA